MNTALLSISGAIFLSASSLIPLFAVSEEKMLVHGDAEDPVAFAAWEGEKEYHADGGRNGGAAFELTKLNGYVISPEWIPVDSKKTYRLEGYFRSLSSETPASAYFGIIMYDAQKRPIPLKSVLAYTNTPNKLAEDAKKRATSLIVANATGWADIPNCAIAFGAQDDFSDLPNFQVSSKVVSYSQRKEGDFEVLLSGPLDRDYPAGTPIRLHSPWGTYLYQIADEWTPTEWTRYTKTLHGEALHGAPTNQFWPGTRFIRVFGMLGNWNRIPKKEARLLMDDVTFVEIETLSNEVNKQP